MSNQSQHEATENQLIQSLLGRSRAELKQSLLSMVEGEISPARVDNHRLGVHLNRSANIAVGTVDRTAFKLNLVFTFDVVTQQGKATFDVTSCHYVDKLQGLGPEAAWSTLVEPEFSRFFQGLNTMYSTTGLNAMYSIEG